jgi:hypothetical protein
MIPGIERPNPFFYKHARGNFRNFLGKIGHGTPSPAHAEGQETIRDGRTAGGPARLVDEPGRDVRRE